MATKPRSEDECRFCHGKLSIIVSRDPDEDVDCVCTEQPRPTEREALLDSVRDRPTITRMAHVTQIEKIEQLRDALRRSEVVPEPGVEGWAARAHAAREKAIAKGYTPDHDAEHGIRHRVALLAKPLVSCPHWAPGKITFRNGCTACAADAAGGVR